MGDRIKDLREPPQSPSDFPVSPLCKSKIIILGDSGVGKSSLLHRLIGSENHGTVQPTIGVDFVSRTVMKKGKPLRLQIWDTAGQERYNSLIPGYIRNATVALIVFDLTSPTGLESIDKWLNKIKACKVESTIILLAGNKADLGSKRVISHEDAVLKARDLGFVYKETSAKTGENAKELFELIVESVESPSFSPDGSGEQHTVTMVDSERQRNCDLENCCFLA